MAASQCGKLILKLADVVEQHSEYLQEQESLDYDMPFGHQGHGTEVDVALNIAVYHYNMCCCDKIPRDVFSLDGNKLCYMQKEPLGVW